MSYVDRPLTLGALQGNRFTIVLRNLAIGNTKTDKPTDTAPEAQTAAVTEVPSLQ
jgi:tRNA(Glu) U13 pseudouridine synthase TruD